MDLKLYIVLKGRVRVYRDEDKNIEFLGKPDLVELMLLDDAYLGVSGKHEDEQDSNLPNPILPLIRPVKFTERFNGFTSRD